jgi:phosphate transport system permease protein
MGEGINALPHSLRLHQRQLIEMSMLSSAEQRFDQEGSSVASDIRNNGQSAYSAESTGSLTLPAAPGIGVGKVATGGPSGDELNKRFRLGDTLIQGVLFFCGALSILTTISLVVVLLIESAKFFSSAIPPAVTLQEFFTGTMWQPRIERFGVLPLLNATLMVSGIAMLVALPLGLFAAMLLSEYAPPRVRATLKPILEVLAGVPTVVYGYFALTFMTPSIQAIIGSLGAVSPVMVVFFLVAMLALAWGLLTYGARLKAQETSDSHSRLAGILIVLGSLAGTVLLIGVLAAIGSLLFGTTVQIYNTAAAGIVVGILIIPLVASMSEDALRAVPNELREAAYGLGGTRLETTLRVVLPAALSGITAAFIVAISRAIGETMIVAIAAGAGPNLTWNPFQSAETITGHINRISGGDLSYNSIDYQSIFALAALLFVMTLLLNIVSRWIMRKFREVY